MEGELHPRTAPHRLTSTRDGAWPALIRRFEACEFETHGVVAALGQLPRAVFDGVPDGLNPTQRQRFRRIELERNEFAGSCDGRPEKNVNGVEAALIELY